jgi:K+-sensing histidine kinase KdpD
VEAVTGIAQRETVSDAVLVCADRVEFIDITRGQLRARCGFAALPAPT